MGKGTQAELLCRDRNLKHVSTGVLLREAVAAGTPLGLKAKDAMSRGDLVADDIILGLIEEALEANEGTGFVLDGFPRNLHQAKALDELLERRGETLDRVVHITADKGEVMRRLSARGRADDDPDTVVHRIEVYERTTAPLIGYYREQGILRDVDGVGSIEDIKERVAASLDAGSDG